MRVDGSCSYDSSIYNEIINGRKTKLSEMNQSETENPIYVNGSSEEGTVPYESLAKDGTIEYNGVTFACDYSSNAICLGDMSDPSSVLNIALPSGGKLNVNVNNFDQLNDAMGMFSFEDRLAIMQAISIYNHCTSTMNEMEDEETQEVTEATSDNTGDTSQLSLMEQIGFHKSEMYQKLMNDEVNPKIQMGSEAMTVEEWDKLMKKFDDAEESMKKATIEEANEDEDPEDLERLIDKLFEDQDTEIA